jgi:hypothetical protein
MKSLKLPLYLAGLLLLPAFLSAQTTFLSVDINGGTGSTATQSGFTALGLTTGSGTGPVTTSFTGLSATYTETGTVGLTLTFTTTAYTARDRSTIVANTGSFTYSDLYRDFVNASVTGGNLTFGFTGLLANTTYQLRFYAYDATSTVGSTKTFTFTDWTSGNAGTGGSTGSVTYTPGVSTFTGAAGDNYLYSTSITATTDASGNLSIRETMGGSYAALFNGFEISSMSSVPEPSTYAAIFGTLALVGAVALRRHRQN